ncbi:MAG: LacI family DNA-binding transcriptional regulator [Clostridia bacterium]|nr:LacI family DNA-binding transcriptional regulator [Clostridia bacterium]
MAKKVTLLQIAQKVGISVNAVSRALNDKSDISESTKAKVRQAAEELGYVANFSARSLRQGKTNTVAVIIPDLFNPLYAMMASEIEHCMSAFGYSVIVLNGDGYEEKEYKSVLFAMERGVDGVIICPVATDTMGMRKLVDAKIPFVSVEKYVTYPEAGYVMRDDTRGGFIAVEHLSSLGHRNIAVIMRDENDYCTQQKIDGISFGCSNYSLNYDNLSINYLDGRKEEMASKLKKILLENDYTAVICGDDITALHTSYLLHKMGKKIPEDISVISFGDFQTQITAYPLLTTIRTPFEKISVEAVEILMAKIKNKEVDDKRILSVDLKIGESTGPASVTWDEYTKNIR